MARLIKDISLDRMASLVGIAVLLVSIFMILRNGFHPVFLVASAIGLACILIYLLALRGTSNLVRPVAIRNSPVLIVLAFLMCVLAWAFFLLRTDPYVKPLMYYVFMSLATGLGVWSASIASRRFHLIIMLAIIIGLSHIYTEHLLFPNSLIGIDPWNHQDKAAEPLILSSLGGRLSLMHPYLKYITEFFNMSYKWASVTFVGAVNTSAVVVLAFVIGRRLFNPRAGCIACLMVASANWVIFFGEWVIPNTLGGLLSLLSAYMVIKINNRWLFPVVAVIVVVAYLTNILIAIWVLLIIVCLRVLPPILSVWSREGLRQALRSLAMPAIATVVPVVLLCFTPMGDSLKRTIEEVVSEPSFGAMVVSVHPEALSPEMVTTSLGTNTIGEMVLASLGMLLYVGVAIIGCLSMLRMSPIHRSFAILSFLVLAVGFVPRLFGISLLEQRWWYLSMVLLPVPLGFFLAGLSSVSFVWRGVTVILVSLVVFLSTIGLASNMSNRDLFPNVTVRYALTDAEVDGLHKTSVYKEVIGTDPMVCTPARRIMEDYNSEVKVVDLRDEFLSGDFTESEANVLFIRKAIYSEPIGTGDGNIYHLNYDIVSTAEKQNYRKLWDNGEVVCLMRY